MCFDSDARPPIPPIAGGAAEAGDRTLTSGDGSRFAAYAARAAQPTHESVVYDGAPHSFFDRRQTEFADASADAWRRVRAFVGARGLGCRGTLGGGR